MGSFCTLSSVFLLFSCFIPPTLFAMLAMLSIGSLSSVSACGFAKGVEPLSDPRYVLSCCLAFGSLPITLLHLTCTPQSCQLSSHSRQAVLYQRYIVLGVPWVLSFVGYTCIADCTCFASTIQLYLFNLLITTQCTPLFTCPV